MDSDVKAALRLVAKLLAGVGALYLLLAALAIGIAKAEALDSHTLDQQCVPVSALAIGKRGEYVKTWLVFQVKWDYKFCIIDMGGGSVACFVDSNIDYDPSGKGKPVGTYLERHEVTVEQLSFCAKEETS